MASRILIAGVTAACLLMVGSESVAQTSLDQPPLDESSAKRLDRMEKSLKEIRAIVFQGRETGQPVVVQPADTDSQIASLTDRLNDLDHTLTRLNGEMEVMRHDLDQSRQEANDLRSQNAALKEEVTALDQKVQGQSGPPPPPPAAQTAPAPEPAPAPTDDPAAAFAEARASFVAGDTASAEAGFRDYVERYGDSPRSPEAHYYLGKTLLARKAWSDAATADIGAIRGWPQTRWAPDAVLDLSRALVGLGKPDDACQTLGELAKRYPKASPAVLKGAQAVGSEAHCS